MATTGARVGGCEELDAGALLYDVYCGAGGWTPPAGNPSGLRVESRNGRSILTDDLASESHWVGCFSGAELVATVRLLDAARQGFEIARYRELPAWLSGADGLEVNRFAVRPGFASPDVGIALAEEVLARALASARRHLVTAVATPEPADRFVALGFQRVGPAPFRYHEDDPGPVEALHLDLGGAAARALDRNRLRSLFGAAG